MIYAEDEELVAFIEHIRTFDGKSIPLYDRYLEQSEDAAAEAAEEWGMVLHETPGIPVPTDNVFYYRGGSDGTPKIPPGFIDNWVYGPRKNVSAQTTMSNLKLAVLNLPEGVEIIDKRSDRGAGWVEWVAFGGIESQLLESSMSPFLITSGNRDRFSQATVHSRDRSLVLAAEVMKLLADRGITMNHLLYDVACPLNTMYPTLNIPTTPSLVDVVSLVAKLAKMPTLGIFSAALSFADWHSFPSTSVEELQQAGENWADLIESGIVDNVVIQFADPDADESVANQFLGGPIKSTPAIGGAVGISIGIGEMYTQTRAALERVIGIDRETQFIYDCSDPAECFSIAVYDRTQADQAQVQEPHIMLPLGVLNLPVQQPSMTVAHFTNTPPVLPGISKQTYRTGADGGINISFTAEDKEQDIFSLSLNPGSLGSLESTRDQAAPWRVEATYSFACESNCPDAFDVTIVASDGDKQSETTFHVVRINASPETNIGGRWVGFGGTSVSGSCASLGPLMFTMDPAWYEAGCLQFRDLDGDVLTFRVSQMPQFGTVNLMVAGSNGNYYITVMYEVDRDEMLACHRARRDLIDRLTVQATDPYGGVSEAQMNIRFDVVNSPPECTDDTASTPSGVPVLIDVLANDSDPDEDALTVVDVSTPAGGTTVIIGNQVGYIPDVGICGIETFTYIADDGYEGQTTASVSVTVLGPVNTIGDLVVYSDHGNHRSPIPSDRGAPSAPAWQCKHLQSSGAQRHPVCG